MKFWLRVKLVEMRIFSSGNEAEYFVWNLKVASKHLWSRKQSLQTTSFFLKEILTSTSLKEDYGCSLVTCYSPYWRYLHSQWTDMVVSCIACGSQILLEKLMHSMQSQSLIGIPSSCLLLFFLSPSEYSNYTWELIPPPVFQNEKIQRGDMEYTDKIKKSHRRTVWTRNKYLCNVQNKKKCLCLPKPHFHLKFQ